MSIKNQNIAEFVNSQFKKITIIHIILISFVLHLFVMGRPPFEVVDETYFTNFTRWFMVGIDHTPYQMFGMSLIEYPFIVTFGDNWFSWRFPVIIFGMVFLYFNYKVIQHIKDKKMAILVTGILAFSPLIFTHSSLLLRDIPVMALGFMAIYIYLKEKYYLSALVLGISALIKETAIFFVAFIVIHYVMTNRKKILLGLMSMKTTKTPIIACMILASVFLVPVAIYDNTIDVLEYSTRYPQYKIMHEGEERVYWFDIRLTNSTTLQMQTSDFNYITKVINPIHHISLMFTNGYLDQRDRGSEKMMFHAVFLPITNENEAVSYVTKERQETFFLEDKYEHHSKKFGTVWDQSFVNYAWWHVAFYSCLALIGYAAYGKIRYKVEFPKEIAFLIGGIVSFFIPYLIVGQSRDVYEYYIIYYLPIMAFGLVLTIYKIPKQRIRKLMMLCFGIAIISSFVLMFPVKLL